MASTSPNSPPKKSAPRSSGAAAAVAAGILTSRLSGLIRQRVFAHYLGNSDAAGAFMAAFRIPNLLQNLFGEGVLSASFIPVYARLLAEGKTEEAGRIAGTVLSLLTLVVGTLAALGMRFSSQMIGLLAPGFHGETRDLTVRLVVVMFPGMALLVVSAWCLGVLNSHRRFFLSYVAPVFSNIAMIAVLVVAGRGFLGSPIEQMRLATWGAWGTVIGAACQLAVQFPWATRLNRGLLLSLNARTRPVKTVIRGFFPAMLARGVVQISSYIDQVLASFLGPQAVAAMAYAQTLSILPVSLFGMSISTTELTEMSRTIGGEEEIRLKVRDRLIHGLQRISFFVVPCSMAFLALGKVLAATLFQTGEFHSADSALVWAILVGSTVGLLATTQSRLCVSAFWALHDTRTPASYAAFRVFLTGALGYATTFPIREALGWQAAYSVAGLTASAGIAGWLEYLLIRRALVRRLGPFGVPFRTMAGYWAAALVSALVALGVDRAVPHRLPIPCWRVIFGLIVLGIYGVGYLSITWKFGAPEARLVVETIGRRLGGRKRSST